MIERNLIIDYELVRGLPYVVEKRVKELIGSCEGWQPKGKLIHTMIGEYKILVQCMVKYES